MRRALVLGAVLVAGCGGGEKAAKPAATAAPTVNAKIKPPPPTEIETFKGKNLTEADSKAFAKRVTGALRGGREAAFMRLIDPRERSVVAQQRTWFQNLQRVPFAHRQVYLVGTRTNIDSSGRRELTADLAFEHRIRGVDRAPVAEWYRYGFRKRGGRLLVASVKGAAPVGDSSYRYSRYYRQAWDDGEMAVVRRGRAVFLGPAADRAGMERLAATADGAVRSVTATLKGLGAPVRPASFAFTLPSPAVPDMFEYFGGYVQRSEARYDGFAPPIYRTDRVTGEVQPERGAITSRIVLNRSLLSGGDAGAVARHEMVHALFETLGSATVDSWVEEGAAVYLSDPPASELSFRRSAGLTGLASARTLPTNARFYRGGDAPVARSYGMAYLAIAYLADRYGRAGLVRRLAKLHAGDLDAAQLQGTSSNRAFLSRVKAWAA